jgi:hypothetical protein
MHRTPRLRRLRRLVIAGLVATTTGVGALAQEVHARPNDPVVPAAIKVPAGNKVFFVGHAIGFQIYSCNATANGYAWGLLEPYARLYGKNGKLVATHYGGPTWHAKDGSTVVAQRVDGVTVDPTAIPWLLLSMVSTTNGPYGDRLTDTTFIQRTRTTGGLSPAASECNSATAGTRVEVPYTADYHFWKAAR